MNGLRFALLAGMLVLTGAAVAPADTETVCAMEGLTPGSRAVRFDLPEGSDFLGIELHGDKPPGIGTDTNWHLAQGIYVVRATTSEAGTTYDLVAYRLVSQGTDPHRATISSQGEGARVPVYGLDGPFIHRNSRPVPDLAPGTYYAIAFGTAGDAAAPNPWWSADLRVEGVHSCVNVGAGDIIDVNHTDFSGGTQVYANGVGYADGISYGFDTSRELVLGMVDASVQFVGDATVTATTPEETFEVDNKLRPLFGPAGSYSFQASYQGLYPIISVAAVAIDLS